MTILQIGHDIGDAPPPETPLVVVGDVGRKPSLQRIALKGAPAIVTAKRRFGRVTGAAMAQAFDKRFWCEAWVWRIFGGKLARDEPGQAC
jgi:hypothetical protein